MEKDIFCSLIKPIFDADECAKYNLDPITDEALEKNKIKREDLETAPSLKLVWSQFCDFVNQYNYRKTKWTAPVRAGYNIVRFDDIIIDRIAGGQNRHLRIVTGTLGTDIKNLISTIKTDEEVKQTKQLKELFRLAKKTMKGDEPYGFGPWDNECTLFHPRDSIDLMKIIWWWTENIQEVKSISMDSMREWLGLSTEDAHQADVDVLQGAQILTRFLKYTRKCSNATKFKGAFK